jgi:hypothetical protein
MQANRMDEQPKEHHLSGYTDRMAQPRNKVLATGLTSAWRACDDAPYFIRIQLIYVRKRAVS